MVPPLTPQAALRPLSVKSRNMLNVSGLVLFHEHTLHSFNLVYTDEQLPREEKIVILLQQHAPNKHTK